MDTTAYDPSSYDPSSFDPRVPVPPTAPPVADVWTSPLWGDPHTIGGVWTDTPPATPSLPEDPAPAPPQRRGARRGLVAVAILLVSALVGAGIVKALPSGEDTPVASPPSASAPAASPPSAQPSAPSDPNQGQLPGIGSLPGDDQGQGQQPGASSTLSPAAAAVAPALVNITSTVGYDGAQAMGTGVVLTSDGVILTNHHVIAGATSIKVAVAGTTTTYTADVLGYDASRDIGVIKLRNASGMTTAPIGDSGTVSEGDKVTGLGNAGGLNGSPIPAEGTVTGLGKSITATDAENGTAEELKGLIETDAAIAPGDSGGALVSNDGKVIGIITAGSQSNAGGRTRTTDGYAIPINDAMAIAQDIRDGKASSTVHIGASAFLGISVASSGTTRVGVTIAKVVSGSAAEAAGLKAGDTITALDGATVTTNASLRAAISPHHPGDTASITWTDTSGKSHTHDVTFGSGPVA